MKKIGTLVMGGIMILIGILFYFNTLKSILGIALYIGIAVFFKGIFSFIAFFKNETNGSRGLLLVISLLDIFLGIIFMGNVGLSVVVIPIYISFWLISLGSIEIAQSFALKEKNFKEWAIFLVMGILMIVCAFTVIFNPIVSTIATINFAGILFMIYGLFYVIRSFMKEKQ